MRLATGTLMALSTLVLGAASLPSGLSPTEIDSLVPILGFPASARLMRSAEAYDPWPGLKLGVEIALSPTQDAERFGRQDGGVPTFNLLPRFHLAKGLWEGFELVGSFLPLESHGGVSSLGGLIKWSFYQERDHWLSAAAFLGYTRVNAYRGDYLGHNVELGIMASKDYVGLRPYLGAGVLFARGEVRPALAQTTAVSAVQSAFHLFLGAEWETPLTFALQLDLMNFKPTGSLSVGKRF